MTRCEAARNASRTLRTTARNASARGRVLRACWRLILGAALGCGSADPGYQGRSTAAWIRQLGDTSVRAREDAADALGRVLALSPRRGDAVRALIQALGDTSDAVRVSVALALAREGVRADGAIPGLAALARDTAHPRVRVIAFETLGRLTHSLPPRDAAPAATTIARALAAGLDDPNREVRVTALKALAGMRRAAGAAASDLAPRLVALARDVDPEVRLGALAALAALPAQPDQVVATGVRMLADSAARVRVGAATALRDLADRAATATPALVGALGDRDPDVRRAAAVALGYVMPTGDGAATAALARARSDPDTAVRLEAAHALTKHHQRGGEDPRPREPSRLELCRSMPPRTPGC